MVVTQDGLSQLWPGFAWLLGSPWLPGNLGYPCLCSRVYLELCQLVLLYTNGTLSHHTHSEMPEDHILCVCDYLLAAELAEDWFQGLSKG